MTNTRMQKRLPRGRLKLLRVREEYIVNHLWPESSKDIVIHRITDAPRMLILCGYQQIGEGPYAIDKRWNVVTHGREVPSS